MGWFKVYNLLAQRHPILFPAAQTAILMGTGDILSQTVIERKTWPEINFNRTCRFIIVGGCLIGPTLSVWYRSLHNVYGSSQYAGMKKMLADQLLMAPVMNTAVISSLALLDGHNLKTIENRLRLTLKDVLIANYKLWPTVQLANFYLVPLQFQVLFVQCFALLWNTYISWKTQNPPSL